MTTWLGCPPQSIPETTKEPPTNLAVSLKFWLFYKFLAGSNFTDFICDRETRQKKISVEVCPSFDKTHFEYGLAATTVCNHLLFVWNASFRNSCPTRYWKPPRALASSQVFCSLSVSFSKIKDLILVTCDFFRENTTFSSKFLSFDIFFPKIMNRFMKCWNLPGKMQLFSS